MKTKLVREPGRIGPEDSSPARIYCSTHPSYSARRAPRSACQACKAMYKLSTDLRKSLRTAAAAFSKEGQDVNLTARLRPGLRFGAGNASISAIMVCDTAKVAG